MRRIAVILGSQSDLPQCHGGFTLLQQACTERKIELVGDVQITSIHRAAEDTLAQVREYHDSNNPPDVLIAGAGWAAHLPGILDSYLRYEVADIQIVVVGVAFEDNDNPEHTQAAKLSISEVPGTQVVFGDAAGQFVGADGFWRACQFAIDGELPTIILPEPRPPEHLTLEAAISAAKGMSQGR
ncbi:MAG: AIR carboxylase family protein [Patescibacteria group bacterium]